MKQKFWQPFIYALLIALGILLGIWLKPGHSVSFGMKNKVTELLHIINQAYVDDVKTDSLEEYALQNMLNHLDPHSVYIPARETQLANESLEGNFEGVGIEFSILDDTIMVVNVIEDGPAYRQGILAGDRIIKVDTTPVAGIKIKNEAVFKLLRGPSGSKVNVTIYRPHKKQTLLFKIQRGTIPIYSVDASMMLNNETGYIKIERFAATTHEEFREALQKLQRQNMQHLILDLRNNPGGYLSAATALADEFLNDKKLVVYTSGRIQSRTNYQAEKAGLFEEGKLIVLIDEGSASASEIVSGAVQDWDRGVSIGRRSFGKGLVQEPFNLSDGSVVRLTVSRYYTPSGRCIQKDYTHGYEAYEEEIHDRFENGEVKDMNKLPIKDTTTYYTSKKRKVFGGGGITPDVFVPVDTSYMNDFFSYVVQHAWLNRFTYAYVDENRNILKTSYPDAETFNLKFSVSEMMWNKFLQQALHNENKFNPAEINQAKPQLKLLLKAFIARQQWRDKGYYLVLSSEDKMIRTSLQTLGNNYHKLLLPH
ncbi:MAG: S41 family peptidase [Bacteroidota bacterium]